MTPMQASKAENHDIIWHRKYDKLIQSKKPTPKFSKSQPVRVAKTKMSLGDKGYTQNYSDEIFYVKEIVKGLGPVRYKLQDKDDELLQGKFYETQLIGLPFDSN